MTFLERSLAAELVDITNWDILTCLEFVRRNPGGARRLAMFAVRWIT